MGESRSAPLGFAFFLIIRTLAFFCFPLSTAGIRKGVGLPHKILCQNTVQGRYLLVDDNGYVCTALSVDSWTRCCPEIGERFSCLGCNLVSNCCNSYEYCVSCCLNPSRTQKDLVVNLKIAKPVTSGNYSSIFDFCAGRCRHNSASVVHENAYASDFHHCYFLEKNTNGVGETNFESRLAGINIIIGRQGESCSSACKSKGKSCVSNKLSVLNKCEMLERYMRCKGSCFASTGADQPAEVVDDAPKQTNPGACLYTEQETLLSCAGTHQHTRRLCPCA
ncbi:hypothetical protein AXF42_Ash014605 [Apostasia shenzhenica]|uniref:SREBP regulating gene protein n=1 Tax=Apostasia shenzhenica TaxID=1088818 RepID=A0A2I0AK45_9ASPA|nr:hypothetical protein AXF42_Ash014605 [Apostasia shenzhenica]